MSEKNSRPQKKAMEMNAATQMQEAIRLIGWPLFPDEQVIFRIERAARKIGISARRAKAYWYGERANVRAQDMDKARALAGLPMVETARDEFEQLQARIARLEAALSVQDEDFHSPQIDAFRRASGRDDRAVDQEVGK